jgi:hypothetical protein
MTGRADVRWIWMAVALVVVAVPVLTVLFGREVRALQQRVSDLEGRIEAIAGRAERAAAAIDQRAVELRAVGDRLAAEQREQLLDVLRTLSAMRPADPEFTEEYYVAREPGGHD